MQHSKQKTFWVEVMQPIQNNGTSKSKKTKQKKSTKSKKRPNTDGDDSEIWHLAKPIVRKLLRPSAKVLCIVPMAVDITLDPDEDIASDEDDEQCFAGVVTELSDDHVRVHLDGLSKKDDVWMSIQSPKLFLDGGQWDKKQDDEALPARHYWLEQDSKRRCV